MTMEELARLAYEVSKMRMEQAGDLDAILPWGDAKGWFLEATNLAVPKNVLTPAALWAAYRTRYLKGKESGILFEELPSSIKTSLDAVMIIVKATQHCGDTYDVPMNSN